MCAASPFGKRDTLAIWLLKPVPRAHSENLVPMIAEALVYCNIEPAALSAVAVSKGPGSYTGLRNWRKHGKGHCIR